MNTYWFKPRDKGYGATPVTWEGWVVTVAAMVVVVMSSLLVPLLADGTYWGLAALVIDVLVIVALLIVGKRKTDGEWRWRWNKS